MTTIDAAGPNAEQIKYWNEVAGPKWVALQELVDEQIRPLGRLAMDRAALVAGERVLEVGCGCGATTIELARRVAPGGTVTGVDISAPMLEHARAVARREGVAIEFQLADAQTHAFQPAGVDVIYSRFGIMFFADPAAAFANLHRAVRPGGRLAFVCWQAVSENPWMFVPLGAAMQHLPPPGMMNPDAPGPFAFANPDRVRGILTAAGFVDVALEPVRQTLTIGGGRDVDATVEFLLQMGPAAAALREAPDPSLKPRVSAAVREALLPYVTQAGVRMDSGSWIVTAHS
jgi:SAM-dependent methyltransferase